MATRRTPGGARTGAKKTTGKTTPRKATQERATSGIARLGLELPPTLAQFAHRVRSRLTRLERRIRKTASPYRRRSTKLLRDASHQLGRYATRGARGWRRLTTRARRDAAKLLRSLEKAVEPQRPRRKTTRKAAAGPR